MNPILRELINKHLSTAAPLPEGFSKFLEELNQHLEAQPSRPVQPAVQQPEMDTEIEKAYQHRGKLAENTTALLNSLAQQETTKSLYTTLVNELADRFDFNRVQMLIYNPVANNLRVSAVAGPNAAMPLAQAAILPLNRGTIGKAADSFNTQIVQAQGIDYSDYPDLISTNIQSEIALPVVLGGELHGKLRGAAQCGDPVPR